MFKRPPQTNQDFMEERGFTLFTNKNGTIRIWVSKLESANDSVNGMDKFLVLDEDISCGEMWEFDPETRKQFTDDEIADMIANVAEDFPNNMIYRVKGVRPELELFTRKETLNGKTFI
jgi:hypothetical protein